MNEPASRHSSANIPYSALRPSSPADRDLQGRHSCRAQTRAVFFKVYLKGPARINRHKCKNTHGNMPELARLLICTHGHTSEEAIELYNGSHLNVYDTTCQHIPFTPQRDGFMCKAWPT